MSDGVGLEFLGIEPPASAASVGAAILRNSLSNGSSDLELSDMGAAAALQRLLFRRLVPTEVVVATSDEVPVLKPCPLPFIVSESDPEGALAVTQQLDSHTSLSVRASSVEDTISLPRGSLLRAINGVIVRPTESHESLLTRIAMDAPLTLTFFTPDPRPTPPASIFDEAVHRLMIQVGRGERAAAEVDGGDSGEESYDEADFVHADAGPAEPAPGEMRAVTAAVRYVCEAAATLGLISCDDLVAPLHEIAAATRDAVARSPPVAQRLFDIVCEQTAFSSLGDSVRHHASLSTVDGVLHQRDMPDVAYSSCMSWLLDRTAAGCFVMEHAIRVTKPRDTVLQRRSVLPSPISSLPPPLNSARLWGAAESALSEIGGAEEAPAQTVSRLGAQFLAVKRAIDATAVEHGVTIGADEFVVALQHVLIKSKPSIPLLALIQVARGSLGPAQAIGELGYVLVGAEALCEDLMTAVVGDLGESPLRIGWLRKLPARSGLGIGIQRMLKRWRRRFIVLRADGVSWSRSEHAVPRGKMAFDADVTVQLHSSALHAFSIHWPRHGVELILQADSAGDVTAWLHAIRLCVQRQDTLRRAALWKRGVEL